MKESTQEERLRTLALIAMINDMTTKIPNNTRRVMLPPNTLILFHDGDEMVGAALGNKAISDFSGIEILPKGNYGLTILYEQIEDMNLHSDVLSLKYRSLVRNKDGSVATRRFSCEGVSHIKQYGHSIDITFKPVEVYVVKIDKDTPFTTDFVKGLFNPDPRGYGRCTYKGPYPITPLF